MDSVRVQQGSITKSGNAHARRLLTEAAWSYGFGARIGKALHDRNAQLPELIREHPWKPNSVCVAGSSDWMAVAYSPTKSACRGPGNWPASSRPSAGCPKVLRWRLPDAVERKWCAVMQYGQR